MVRQNRRKDGGEPLREAAALKYDPENASAPVAVALGQGFVAKKMIETALEHEVKVVEDASLAHLLNKLSVGDEIPPELYGIVAQVLVFVSEMDYAYAEKINKLKQKV